MLANPVSLQGLKPRLGTSVSLAFTFPDWLAERLSEAFSALFEALSARCARPS